MSTSTDTPAGAAAGERMPHADGPQPPSRWMGAWAAGLWPALGHHLGARLAIKDQSSGAWIWVDPQLAEGWGRRADQLAGAPSGAGFDASTAAALRAADLTALEHGGVLSSEHRFTAGGRTHDVQVLRLAGPEDAEGRRPLAMVWIDREPALRQQAQLRRALEQIEALQKAQQDSLDAPVAAARDADSGLLTRGHFDDQLRREIDLSMREHREFALVLLEVDPLDDAARGLGAAAASRVREAIGRLLRSNTRAMDAACRYDADRFAVLLSGVGLATAHSRMEGLRRQCATQVVVQDGREFGFSVAMGVASFPHTAQVKDELLQAVETALAEARRRGGNHVALASIRFEAH